MNQADKNLSPHDLILATWKRNIFFFKAYPQAGSRGCWICDKASHWCRNCPHRAKFDKKHPQGLHGRRKRVPDVEVGHSEYGSSKSPWSPSWKFARGNILNCMGHRPRSLPRRRSPQRRIMVPSPASKGLVRGQLRKDDVSAPESWVFNIRIRSSIDETLHWDPVTVQMEANC